MTSPLVGAVSLALFASILIVAHCGTHTSALPISRQLVQPDDWEQVGLAGVQYQQVPFSHFGRLIAMEKKASDPVLAGALGDEFMSAMNGASRLRYGKRGNNYRNAQASGVFIDAIPMQVELPVRWATGGSAKRMSAFSSGSVPASLVDSLNGAERLRFG